MNYRHRNPTPVQLGMSGEFVGKHYRVAGRVVMGMEYDGQTYYWNEFNLIDDQGGNATLVFEQTERGGEWKLFTLLEPAPPISLAEAEAKREGDTFEFNGRNLRVSCVDESRVYAIEGEAPEGVELGDIARYFNANAGNEMIVVSWTGNEIEFFRGLNIPTHAVMTAFGIQHTPRPQVQARGSESMPTSSGFTVNKYVIGLLVAIGAIVFLFNPFSCKRSSSSAKPETMQAPKITLPLGATGKLNGAAYRILGVARVEIGHDGKRYLRHEYLLADDATNQLLLVQGTKDGADKWALLTPFEPPHPLRPTEAAAQWVGQLMPFEKPLAAVTDLFQTRVHSAHGTLPYTNNATLYGLLARSGDKQIVMRWDEREVLHYTVRALDADVPKAFAPR